jgi:PAS domain S-box-containing protein
MFVLSPSGNFLFSSPSALKHLGVSPDVLEGRIVTEYLHPEDHELVMRQLRKYTPDAGSEVPDDRSEFSIYCRFKKNGGDFVLMDLKGKPFPDKVSDGPVKYFVHAAREYR